MDSLDPYRPPRADLDTEQEQQKPALGGRLVRLGAAVIDGCLSWVFTGFPVLLLTGLSTPGVVTTVIATCAGNLAYAAVQAGFLLKSSGTLGKRLVGLAVCSADGTRASPLQLLALRPSIGIMMVLAQLPVLVLADGLGQGFPSFAETGGATPAAGLVAAGLVWFALSLLSTIDALMIFRRDRRCLHDLIASTVVVEAGPWQRQLARRAKSGSDVPKRGMSGELRGAI